MHNESHPYFKKNNVTFILCLVAIIFLFPTPHQAKEFHVEGSDLLMGVGANAIGLSGAITASITGIYSVYWNPAGLAESSSNEINASSQLNSKILPFNFAGIMLSPDWLQIEGYQSSIAFSWIPRLYMQAEGAYKESDIESIFLRFTLPGLPGDFDGKIKSKTKDFRFTWAIMPKENPLWSFGLSISRVDCQTFFCGVTAKQPGQYVTTSTKAKAFAFHLGGKYYLNEDTTLGFNFKDLNTSLDVGVQTDFQNGTSRYNTYEVKFPKDITVGAQWKYSDNISTSLDYQTLLGNYGRYSIDFKILRFGLEYTSNHMRYRYGLLAPLKLSADKVSDYRDSLLFPVAPSFGIGWNRGNLSVDAALYAQLIMSAQRKAVVPGIDLSISHHF